MIWVCWYAIKANFKNNIAFIKRDHFCLIFCCNTNGFCVNTGRYLLAVRYYLLSYFSQLVCHKRIKLANLFPLIVIMYLRFAKDFVSQGTFMSIYRTHNNLFQKFCKEAPT